MNAELVRGREGHHTESTGSTWGNGTTVVGSICAAANAVPDARRYPNKPARAFPATALEDVDSERLYGFRKTVIDRWAPLEYTPSDGRGVCGRRPRPVGDRSTV